MPDPAATFSFTAPLWVWDGDAAWHFVTVPAAISDEVEHRTLGHRRGFGSVRVVVTVDETTWSTSLFPDRARGAYLLPVKRAVRDAASLAVGDPVAVTLELAAG